ncbi:MAG: hypothetical protein IJD45_04550 [Clostridia bacterium]|nr:hypothetical protein [Clostridia bacterium]
MKHPDYINIPEKFKDRPIFNELVCGTNFGFMNKRGYYETEKAKEQPNLMNKMGINWTTLNLNVCQEKFSSTKLFMDFERTSTDNEICDMTKLLHENGVRVILKPCLCSLDGAAMHKIYFPCEGDCRQIAGKSTNYWREWFDSYIEAIKYAAQLSEKAGVDALMIGAELVGTEGQNEYWEELIEEVRKHYSGPITYEFTFLSRKTYDLNWLNKVDFLAYSYYPPASPPTPNMNAFETPDVLNRPTPTVEEMKEYLSSRKEKIKSIVERFGNKPILFTEYGIRSARGCSMYPTNSQWNTPYDGEEQANYMEASFQTFMDVPGWMGLLWWKWDECQHRPQYHGDPNGDRGFTIQGKPAEKVMRDWFIKINKR